MLDKKTIINLMYRPGWNSDQEDCRDLEKILVQTLRISDDTTEILEICEALGMKGSLFVTPVLMAKMAVTVDKTRHSYFMATLAMIMSRMQGWQPGPDKDFFNPEWWQIKWKGGNQRFISFIALLAGAGADSAFDEGKMEELAELFIPEMNVDLDPYLTFKELRLLSPDWDPSEDLKLIRDAVEEDQLMAQVHDESLISKNEDTQVSDNIMDMHVDYLVTKLGLHHDFDHYHYLLRIALILNQPKANH
ncbi:hypothetical protein OC25_17655 [Pedobacter kyungheensis]|uniref:Uncharacterized protein n=1 Tax=Pedobacter kyungheensis TaxID=1069985 RepID=A0A0C1DE99_9SPHI|nr:hypothetical protein [Pedobacter kyungheensis]KIA92260.1 hypothetical protein OC25_17655 [Pedobacter kyungheensis]